MMDVIGSPRTRLLFVAMLREEWRLHSRLFSGRRFALFPIFIVLLVAGGAGLLLVTGQDPGAIYAGLHALAFVFGLNTGSIGFVGRDAVRNLLGEVTLLVFSARTLPLSRTHLFGVFLVKDVVYYAILFLLPMAVGMVGSLVAAGSLGPVPAMGTALLLWATVIGMFVLGTGATLAGLGLARRGTAGPALLVGVAAALGLGWVAGFDILSYTPYGVFRRPAADRLAGSLGLIAVVFVVAGITFDLSDRRVVRTVDPAFRRWNARIREPLATKTLLDVHRSSGGFGKVVFSGAILLAVTAALVDLAGQITGVEPSVGISFGSILGLTGFTTYNWLTQFDDVDSYQHHPIDVRAVFGAKYRAFLLLGPVVGLVFYGLAILWLGGPVLSSLVGALLLVGVASYVFGVTVALTGLSPNEFLFDTLLFAAFGLAMMVPLVPILVVGFALAPVEGTLLAGLGVLGIVLALIGTGLYRLSLEKWAAHYRR